ncbi:hypothetical protein bcere0004_56670 [Bacillus cereus BGSC 6E1]|nr:hypothetical protein bcere0004_56670 [Bacillus cereus BGSC 6E1]
MEKKDVAIIPQQPGFKYAETSGGVNSSQRVDESANLMADNKVYHKINDLNNLFIFCFDVF